MCQKYFKNRTKKQNSRLQNRDGIKFVGNIQDIYQERNIKTIALD